jgi:hypothetical protein
VSIQNPENAIQSFTFGSSWRKVKALIFAVPTLARSWVKVAWGIISAQWYTHSRMMHRNEYIFSLFSRVGGKSQGNLGYYTLIVLCAGDPVISLY